MRISRTLYHFCIRSVHSRTAWPIAVLAGSLLFFASGPAAAQPPPNDDFDDAIAFELPFQGEADTAEATNQALDPLFCPFAFVPTATVWYSFTPEDDVTVAILTYGSNYDTTLTVLTGEPGAFATIACNDDFLGLAAQVLFDAVAGETYYIMASALYGTGGQLRLSALEYEPPPPLELDVTVDSHGTFDPGTGRATMSGTLTCNTIAVVDVYPTLRQKIAGHLLVTGDGYFPIICDGTIPWSVEVTAFNGLFKGGKAEGSCGAFGFTPFGEFFAFDTEPFQPVKLTKH